MGNVSLKNVTVDENVNKINECAFRGTKIEKIELSGGRADADTSLTKQRMHFQTAIIWRILQVATEYLR